ncbi:MAG: PIN domain-containing protein [Methanosarcinales archaeon]
MRILIDTNIFIGRENNHVLSDELQALLKILNSKQIEILIHPKSFEEIRRDSNISRKNIALSKLNTYPILEHSPDQNKDDDFLSIVGISSKINDEVDNAILYSVYRDAVDFLITEDKGIHKKSIQLDISDRVLCVDEGIDVFGKELLKEEVVKPPALKEDAVHNFDLSDPIFDSLKKEYGESEFSNWFRKSSREGRKCWVHYRIDGSIGALLIRKIENEAIKSIPPLPAKKRLKIATLKVTHVGYKIGELLVKLAIDHAIKNNIDEIYLTHFTNPDNDYLVDLITEYGFYKAAIKDDGEKIFVKELLVDKDKIASMHPLEISNMFYPSLYDGDEVNKFLVPIRPEYHQRLFTDYKGRQTSLLEHAGEFIIEGNTIKKAYLSSSRIKNLSKGDILLFYRTIDRSEITSLGVVEKVLYGLQDKNIIFRNVRKRTVYSMEEIESMAKKPTLVILFKLHFHLLNPLKLKDLKTMGVFAPQSIAQISDEKYLQIKTRGEIDERFTVN